MTLPTTKQIISKYKDYSDFANNATPEEKEIVIVEAIKKANKIQRDMVAKVETKKAQKSLSSLSTTISETDKSIISQSTTKQRIEEILEEFARLFAKVWDKKTNSWWGHDTNLGNLDEEFLEATQSLEDLVRSERVKELDLLLKACKKGEVKGLTLRYKDIKDYYDSRIKELL